MSDETVEALGVARVGSAEETQSLRMTEFSRWGIKLTVFSIVLVLVMTLFPYDFFCDRMVTPVLYGSRVLGSRNGEASADFLGNIHYFLAHLWLFALVGFGLTCLTRDRFPGLSGLLVVVMGAACLSLTVEVLQIVLPSRSGSLSDALPNLLGTLLGFMIFCFRGPQIVKYASILLDKSIHALSMKILTTVFLGYAALIFFVSISLQQAISLANWDDHFPLLIGNERTGNQLWEGTIYKLQIMNRAMTPKEVGRRFSENGLFPSITGPVLVSYQWTDGQILNGQSAHLPELVWKGESANIGQGDGLAFNGRNWLETARPPIALIRQLRKTSQFTLSTVVATADTAQIGPARIVSLSGDSYHRNFTLGQQESHLVFRLRTPLTGRNGMEPEFIAPDVFATRDPQHLIISYDGSSLLLFVDGHKHSHSLRLSPGATLFKYISPIKADAMMDYKLMYYGLVFIPLGCLLGFMVKNVMSSILVHRLVIGGGIFMPSLMLESILANVSGRSLSLDNLLLSILLTTGAMVLFSFLSS